MHLGGILSMSRIVSEFKKLYTSDPWFMKLQAKNFSNTHTELYDRKSTAAGNESIFHGFFQTNGLLRQDPNGPSRTRPPKKLQFDPGKEVMKLCVDQKLARRADGVSSASTPYPLEFRFIRIMRRWRHGCCRFVVSDIARVDSDINRLRHSGKRTTPHSRLHYGSQ